MPSRSTSSTTTARSSTTSTTYLLDTNALIFHLTEDLGRLSPAQRQVLYHTPGSEFRLSTASILELAMLQRKGKLTLRPNTTIDTWLPGELRRQRIRLLPVLARHSFRTAMLPRPDKTHNDPMDLLIIAQAIEEQLPVISSDDRFPLYAPDGLQVIS